MYKIGDAVSYPMHGAGVIESIEEKCILGEYHKYYVLKLLIGNVKLMVPLSNSDEVGLRYIINPKEADKVLKEFKRFSEDDNPVWNKRYQFNISRLKGGDLVDVAYVVKTLMLREKSKGLSTAERKMLNTSKNIFISELIHAKNSDYDTIENEINSLIG